MSQLSIRKKDVYGDPVWMVYFKGKYVAHFYGQGLDWKLYQPDPHYSEGLQLPQAFASLISELSLEQARIGIALWILEQKDKGWSDAIPLEQEPEEVIDIFTKEEHQQIAEFEKQFL